jgi:Nif-specific regulatory protein
VRELENCVRRTATLAHGASISASDFACRNDECLSAMLWKHTEPAAAFVPLTHGSLRVRHGVRPPAADTATGHAGAVRPEPDAEDVPVDWLPLGADDARSERERLIDVMESVGWVQAKAARVLGLTPRQVGYALRKHEIPIKKF